MPTVLDRTETPAPPRGRLAEWVPALSIVVIGLAARLSAILNSGGLRGNYGYDASVYYTAADAFIHGRMPYRDFLLLHPPGSMLALVPFAALGEVTSDLKGFIAGNLAFVVLGALSGALVYWVARRMGLSRGAAWLGGAFYAVWAGAVYVETSSRLEPLGAFVFLWGMVALTGSPERYRRNAVLAGAVLAFAACVKIWWIAPLVVIAIWMWWQPDGRQRLLRLLAGAAALWVVVLGPFFVMAPHDMIRMILQDQVGRDSTVPLATRLIAFTTVTDAAPQVGHAKVAVCVAFLVILAAVCALAWRFRPARLFVVLAVLHLVVLAVAPSFFTTYLGFVAPPLALTVAAAAQGRGVTRWAQLPAVAVIVAGMATVTAVSNARYPYTIGWFPTRELAAHRPASGCVTAITPVPLIELDVLSRNLAHGCRQWVDSYGRTYDVDKNAIAARRDNPVWQADLQGYLLSGHAVVLALPDKAIGPQLLRIFTHEYRVVRTVLASKGGSSVAIYMVRH